MDEQTKINAEIARLTENLRYLPAERLENAQGLIQQCAYLRVKLDSLATELDKDGWTHETAQGVVQRPEARLYCTLSGQYHKYATALDKLISQCAASVSGDGFDGFVGERDEF